MPTLTRYFIKAGLLNFIAALVLGIAQQFSDSWPAVAILTPVYFHLFMFGWITQVIIGVSIWMFPPLSRDNPRGNEVTGWICFGCLNIGLWLRGIFEPAVSGNVTSDWQLTLLASAFLQWAAGILYVSLIWKRVRGK